MEKDQPCSFVELCKTCHPEAEMVEKRKECTDKTCKKCGVYWAFKDGYSGLDEE